MSGFGTVISFTFAMFVSMGAMVSAIYVYNDQINQQEELQKKNIEDFRLSALEEIEISTVSYTSDRLILEIENTGSENYVTVEDNVPCFDIFVDNTYIYSELVGFSLSSRLSEGFSFIKPGLSGRIFAYPGNITNISTVVFSSCSGKKYTIELSDLNFEQEDYRERSLITQSATISGNNTQQNLVLNTNDIDLPLVETDEIVIEMDISHIERLNLGLDAVTQFDQDETGNFNVTLGDSNVVEPGVDPSESNGIVIRGLDFDLGEKLVVEDFVLLNRSTVAFWFKPDSTLTSFSNQINFSQSGNDFRIVFNQEGDGRIGFYTYTAPWVVDFSLKTATNEFDSGQWYHLAFVFDNDDIHSVYLNGNLEATSGSTLTLPVATNDLEIGNLD